MSSDQLRAVSTSGEPTDAEVDDMAARVRNWSGWGDDDQCGTTNLSSALPRVDAQRGFGISSSRSRWLRFELMRHLPSSHLR
jgi:hypothetical protein